MPTVKNERQCNDNPSSDTDRILIFAGLDVILLAFKLKFNLTPPQTRCEFQPIYIAKNVMGLEVNETRLHNRHHAYRQRKGSSEVLRWGEIEKREEQEGGGKRGAPNFFGENNRKLTVPVPAHTHKKDRLSKVTVMTSEDYKAKGS
jgi:hypothetical protein